MAQWISVTEASRLTGYSTPHLRELIKIGAIKARKVVIVWQIDKSTLTAYIKKQAERGEKRGPKKGG